MQTPTLWVCVRCGKEKHIKVGEKNVELDSCGNVICEHDWEFKYCWVQNDEHARYECAKCGDEKEDL